jgi:transposase
MIVHADNAGPYVAKCVTEYMDHNSLKRAPRPPHSPDLAPSDFYTFGYVKHRLQSHQFTEGAELASAISENVNQIPIDAFVDVFDKWMRRFQ